MKKIQQRLRKVEAIAALEEKEIKEKRAEVATKNFFVAKADEVKVLAFKANGFATDCENARVSLISPLTTKNELISTLNLSQNDIREERYVEACAKMIAAGDAVAADEETVSDLEGVVLRLEAQLTTAKMKLHGSKINLAATKSRVRSAEVGRSAPVVTEDQLTETLQLEGPGAFALEWSPVGQVSGNLPGFMLAITASAE